MISLYNESPTKSKDGGVKVGKTDLAKNVHQTSVAEVNDPSLNQMMMAMIDAGNQGSSCILFPSNSKTNQDSLQAVKEQSIIKPVNCLSPLNNQSGDFTPTHSNTMNTATVSVTQDNISNL